MKRLAMFVVGLVVGLVVGRITCGTDPPRAPLDDYKRAIEVRRGDDRGVYLAPYKVCSDGQCEPVREPDDGPRWMVWYYGARVQVYYTEQPAPR